MLIRLALALALVLTASCNATPTPFTSLPTPAPSAPSTSTGLPKPFEPPKWVKTAPGIPLTVGPDWQGAGWDGGLLLAAGVNSHDFELFTSKDGHDWRASAPVRMIPLDFFRGRVVAGYGAAGYLVGWTSQGPTVWRTEDGERGETIPLQLGDLKVRSPLDLSVTIAAGPRGVIVVGSDTFTPPHYHGVYVWYSPDGRSFGGLARVPGRVDEEPSSAVVQATPNCFLLGNGTMLLSSEDGVHWQDITTGMPRTRGIVHVSGNSSTVVVFTSHWPSDPPEEPLAWYRHDGTWRPAPMDPGRLPDAGVVPVDQRRVNAVRNWGTGFIAIGNTQGDEGTEIAGMVWYSADGSSWTRMPVRDNGFDTALRLLDIAISRQKAVLVGSPSYRSENLLTLTWQADAPPNP